jgi:hypothetical protein
MKRILRLYPSAWRERYHEEMESILDERPQGPFEMVDLLLGALDAHLHLRGLGNPSEHRKGITMSLRTAGSAAIIGGALWGLAMLLLLLAELTGRGDDEQPFAFFLIIGAAAALLVAFTGLSAFQARTHRKAVWAGFAIAAVGFVMVIGGWGGMMIIDGLYWVGIAGMLAIIAGSVVFGAITYMTGALSRAGGALLAIGSTVQLLALLIAFAGLDGPAPGSELLLIAGGVGFAAGWITLGVDGVRRDRPSAADSPTPA